MVGEGLFFINGIQEVRGSNPLGSTTRNPVHNGVLLIPTPGDVGPLVWIVCE